jgi:hypothetical protein
MTSLRIEDNKKWSNTPSLIASAEAVVREDMATWPSAPKKMPANFLFEGSEEKTLEGFDTPFGWLNNLQVRNLVPYMIKETQKNIYKKYGRSKYNPHQGVKECAKRAALTV